jgi:hypothetical protein
VADGNTAALSGVIRERWPSRVTLPQAYHNEACNSSTAVPSLRVLAISLAAFAVTVWLVIAATGNMHSAKHHPLWVDLVSWLFAVCAYGLVILGVIAIRRRRRRSVG